MRWNFFLLIPGLAVAATALAQKPPLSPEEVSRCAELSLEIRNESLALREKGEQFQGRRAELEALHNDLRPTELGANQRYEHYSEGATQLEKRLVPFQKAVDALNGRKNHFGQLCSGRPYNPADVEKLPADQQAAFEDGPIDIIVPRVHH